MFTTEIRIGRLYEHRLRTLESLDELQQLRKRGIEVMTGVSGSVVACADFRRVSFVKAEFVYPFIDFLKTANPRIERSGVLLSSEHAIFSMQMKRMIREAQFAGRRAFDSAAELEGWLGEALTPVERGRLTQFLAEG